MKRFYLFLIVSLVALLSSGTASAQQNTAISIPPKSDNNYYQFRFDDALLGPHTAGSLDNDHRVRDITLSAWIKTNGTGGDILGLIQNDRYVATGSFAVQLTNGKLGLFCRSLKGTSFPNEDAITKTSQTELPINTWAFITLVVDNTNKNLRLYKDGTLVMNENVKNDGIGYLPDASVFFVGCMEFTGALNQVQLWNKVMTEEEVAQSMHIISPQPDMFAFYTFTNPTKDNTYINQVDGDNTPAMLVKGPQEDGTQQWMGKFYRPNTVAAEMVEGPTVKTFAVTYNGDNDGNGNSFVVKNGTETVTSGTSVIEGTLLTVETTTAPNYQVKNIKVNNTAIKGDSFTLTEASVITVEFTNQLLLESSVSTGGTLEIKSGEDILNNGDTFTNPSDITLKATPDEHYHIASLKVNDIERKNDLKNNTLTINGVAANLKVEAAFAIDQYAVIFSTNNSLGSLKITQAGAQVNSGDMIDWNTELTGTLAYPQTVLLKSLTLNGNEIKELVSNNTFSFTLGAAAEIIAAFENKKYAVTFDAAPQYGKVEVTKDSAPEALLTSGDKVDVNTDITVKLIPDKSYELENFTVNGEDLTSSVTDGEFYYNVISPVTFTATFHLAEGITSVRDDNQPAYYNHNESKLYVSGDYTVIIFNLSGQEIFRATGTTGLSHLPNGSYIAKVVMPDKISTLKFIK